MKKVFRFFFFVFPVLAFLGCGDSLMGPEGTTGGQDPSASPGPAGQPENPPAAGAIRVILEPQGELRRTLGPPIPLPLESYRVVIYEVPYQILIEETVKESTTWEGFPPATYQVEVDGYNAEGIRVGGGKNTAKVESGRTTACTVVVREEDQPGSLELDVDWAPLANARLEVRLRARGAAGPGARLYPLYWILEDGRKELDPPQGALLKGAHFSEDQYLVGWYTLHLVLYEGDTVVSEAQEEARMVSNQTTFGSIHLGP